MTTNATATRRSSVNRSVETTSSRVEDGAEGDSGGRRVLALTDADFPRVLNGPAPGYAEDALRRLLGVLPAESEEALRDAGRRRSRDGALERAPAASGAIGEADQQPLDWGAGAEGGSASGAAGLESAAVARASGSEGHVGAALSEGFSWEYSDDEKQPQQVTGWIVGVAVDPWMSRGRQADMQWMETSCRMVLYELLCRCTTRSWQLDPGCCRRVLHEHASNNAGGHLRT